MTDYMIPGLVTTLHFSYQAFSLLLRYENENEVNENYVNKPSWTRYWMRIRLKIEIISSTDLCCILY